jgi:hypothetical protein
MNVGAIYWKQRKFQNNCLKLPFYCHLLRVFSSELNEGSERFEA